MKAIWKFPISLDPLAVSFTQVIRIPVGARLLHGGAQGPSKVSLWFEVSPEAAKEERHFQVFGTGAKDVGDHLTHVTTAVLADGQLVLHIYEVTGEAT